MDARRFEEFTHRVAAAGSRRATLKALAGVLAAPALALRGEEAAAGIPIVN